MGVDGPECPFRSLAIGACAEEVIHDVEGLVHLGGAQTPPDEPETPAGPVTAPTQAHTPETGGEAPPLPDPPVSDVLDKNAFALETTFLQSFESRLRGILSLILTRTKPSELIKELEALAEESKSWL